MTKVSYIHGIASNNPPKVMAERKFINFANMTDGEMRLTLLADQLSIQAEYYGLDEYNALSQRLLSTVKQGLHSGKISIGSIPGRLAKAVNKEIGRAMRMKRPAAGKFVKGRSLSKGINGPLIPLRDCEALMDWDEIDSEEGLSYGLVETPESWECKRINDHLRFLNNHLEGSSHHLMYEYLENSAQSNSTVSAKKVLHRNAISKLSEITEVDRTNLRLWLRNGIMRNNVANNTEPFQPEQVIAKMREAGAKGIWPNTAELNTAISVTNSQSALSGEPISLIILAIAKALIAAITATAALIQSIQANKRQQLLVAAQGIGTSTFGPEANDWPFDPSFQNTPGQNNPPSNNGGLLGGGDMTPLLLGGAALLLLK